MFLLPGCGMTARSPGKPLPQMTFEHLSVIPIDVYKMETILEEGATVSDDFAVSPYIAFESYMNSRFRPAGTGGALVARIEKAQVVAKTKEPQNSFMKFLNLGHEDVYTVHLHIRLEHVGREGFVEYGKALSSKRVIHISEHASIAERETAQLEGVEALFRKMDAAIYQTVVNEMRLKL